MFIVNLYKKMSPFQRVIIALLLGISTGIIIGEPTGNLEILGNAYIRLLQMTVIPYVLVSIAGGLGKLDSDMASSIGIRAVKVILMIWLSVMLTLLLLPLAYPNWETSGFFSSSLITEAAQFNFLDLYIPANIFASLSNTIMPAVVLFSLLMGIALIRVKNKEMFLSLASNIGDSLMGMASYVAKLAPLGIFAISAAAAGTLQVEELGRLQVFLWVYLIAAALLGLVLLPLIIHWATPFSYREVLSTAGEAVITALATGTVLVVLPMIVDRCKELLAKHGMDCEETHSTVDVIVPTAYSFPSTGTLLGLGFILFSAWYVGSPLTLDQYPSYVIMGALTAFGSMSVAIPFMLDFFGLPADQFQLYLLGSVVTARFATGLAALHGFVATLLVASAVLNRLKWHRMAQAIGVHLGITFAVMIAAGMTLTYLIPYEYTGVRTFESMQLMAQPAKISNMKQLTPLSQAEQSRPRMDVIQERGTIRVGYFSNTLPYAFRNGNNKVVGFDMELIHALANDLDMKIKIIRLKSRDIEVQALTDGSIDITIGGRAITPKRALDVTFSDSYTFHTAGLLLTDSRKDEYATLEQINMNNDVTLGYIPSNYYKKIAQKYFPNAKLVEVDSPRNFIKGKPEGVDALIFSTETASAWAMLYPEYSAIIPKGLKLRAPVGLTMPKGEIEYAQFINTWLKLKKENGFQQQVYNYWILGQNPKAKKIRWSVIKDVFGWDI
ncbi:Symporter with substrate-binding domain [hydrothermal vent metagenome]|uniref:Symporter with substrate-binding domain n=1 Tax=hydrothermal vent metagenome TaxID=652676 RepID=A0A3B0Y6U6_9ZZZZ